MRRRRYPIPNTSRPSWCFLVLQSQIDGETREITGWELVVGNSDRIVETSELTDQDVEGEAALLAELMAELSQYQASRPELYTFSAAGLKLLRTRLVVVDHEPLSLRGYRHIVLRDLLDYFGPWWPDVVRATGIELEVDEETTEFCGGTVSAESLWALRQHIGSLLPPEVLKGEVL